jgi:hypothetical protein
VASWSLTSLYSGLASSEKSLTSRNIKNIKWNVNYEVIKWILNGKVMRII